MRRERFGELSARVVGGNDGRGGGDGPVVVLLHGFGAPGDDLVGLAPYLRLPGARFVFPEAPLGIAGGGRAWWMLDMELFERRARGERIDRSGELPPALPAVRAQVLEMLAAIEASLGVPRRRMVIGGFSQGAMVACDATLHMDPLPAGLVLLSTTLIARDVWSERVTRLSGLPVLQSHGIADPLLEHADAVRVRDLLRDAGADVTFVEFAGGHEIDAGTLQALQTFLQTHAK